MKVKALFLGALVFSLLVSPASAAKVLRLAGNIQPEHSSSRAMEIFKTKLAEYSKGELTAEVFPGLQLGGAAENVDQVRNGTIFATWLTIGYLSRTVPELEAVSIPFIFPDRDAAFRVMDGKVGDLLNERLGEKGFQALGYMEVGARNVTNNIRPLKSVEDFKGLKIRLQPNQTHIATFEALGASPIAMDVKEVYQALQQGVIDGQENPFALIRASRYNEVQKYLSDTSHFFDFVIVAASKKQYDSFSEEERTAIEKAMAEAVAWQRQTAVTEDAESLKFLVDSGMQFDPISPEVRAVLREKTKAVIDQVKAKVGDELVNAVLAEIAK